MTFGSDPLMPQFATPSRKVWEMAPPTLALKMAREAGTTGEVVIAPASSSPAVLNVGLEDAQERSEVMALTFARKDADLSGR